MDYSKEAVEVFNDLAKQYEAKYMSVERYHSVLDLFCKKLVQKGSVLELACGPGNATKYILEQRTDLIYTATDLSENMITLAEKNNPGIKTQVLDCRNLSSLQEKYDGVVSAFCLPYLNKQEVKKKFEDIFLTLNDGGIFYVSGIKGEYNNSAYSQSVSYPKHKVFMHYYDEKVLEEILLDIGFKPIHNKIIKYKNAQNEETSEFMIVVQK